MIKNRKLIIILMSIFCVIETILFFLVQIFEGEANDCVSFLVVVLACAFMIVSISNTKDYYFMQIGLICTVFADYFLVVSEPMEELTALCFFSVTQICYFLRLFFKHKVKRAKYIHLIVRLSISIIALVIATIILKDDTDALSLVSVFYYANLALNIVVAFTQYKISLLFPIGLLLFLMCDTLVGLNGIFSYYFVGENTLIIQEIVFGTLNWAWIFYVPSQTLLALSLIKLPKEKKKSLI